MKMNDGPQIAFSSNSDSHGRIAALEQTLFEREGNNLKQDRQQQQEEKPNTTVFGMKC